MERDRDKEKEAGRYGEAWSPAAPSHVNQGTAKASAWERDLACGRRRLE